VNARSGRKTTAIDLRRAGKFPEKTFPRDGGEGTVFSNVSSPRGKATKRRAALHICDPKSAEKSMPRRVARIPCNNILYIYLIGGWTTKPALRSTLCGLILQFLTTFGCNHPDKTISFSWTSLCGSFVPI